MNRINEIKERCTKTVSELRELLPPQEDYAELVCAEGFAHGMHYVWTEPEPYAMDGAAKLIEDLLGEVERLTAELAAAKKDLRRSGACFACKNFYRNDGDCTGAARCRIIGMEIFPCDEPGTYRVEIPDDGRKTYEWRGLCTENGG